MKAISNGKHKSYFNSEKVLLKVCGIALDDHQVGIIYKIYSFVVRYIFSMLYPFVAAGDLFKHEFIVVAQIFPVVFTTCLTGIVSFETFRNRKKLEKLLNTLDQTIFVTENSDDEEQKRLTNGWLFFKIKQAQLLYTGGLVCALSGTVYSLVKRIRTRNPEEWVYAFAFGPLTFLDVTRSPNYEITWFYQNAALSLAAAVLTPVLVLLTGALAYVRAQLQILQHNLKTILNPSEVEKFLMIKNSSRCLPRPKELEGVTEYPWEYFKTAIKRMVTYHLEVLEIVSQVETIFSILMLASYLLILCFLCFIMFTVTSLPLQDPRTIMLLTEGVVAFYMPLTVCYWGEQVAIESEQVGNAAYEAYLVGTDVRFQKSLNLITLRSQRAVRIKAGKLAETSLVTFMWFGLFQIVRSAFSYFMVMRNINMEK